MGKRVNAILVGGMLIFMQSLFHSCSWNAKQDIDIKYGVRDAVNQVSSLNLQKEISSVSYVPLETTNDDESLIDGVLDYAVTENHIYILPANPHPFLSVFKPKRCASVAYFPFCENISGRPPVYVHKKGPDFRGLFLFYPITS